MTRTDWFTDDIKPARAGAYEVTDMRFLAGDAAVALPNEITMWRFDGDRWFYGTQGFTKVPASVAFKWRGLVAEAVE